MGFKTLQTTLNSQLDVFYGYNFCDMMRDSIFGDLGLMKYLWRHPVLHCEPALMANEPDENGGGRTGTVVVTKPKPQVKRPHLYRVLLLNDDYTPMEFVIHVLESFFHKSHEDATHIMLHVHHTGVGECGVFTYEVAETKVTQVMDFARKHQHPLQCVMEKK
jgi:ATP-dependent Clp protease adaptor protein ClpS